VHGIWTARATHYSESVSASREVRMPLTSNAATVPHIQLPGAKLTLPLWAARHGAVAPHL